MSARPDIPCFWKELKSPFIALAPMEDVTDTVFRALIMGNSTPGCLDVVFTEFTSTDGLCHEVGREKVIHRLLVSPEERKLLAEMGIRLVAQIWGSDPEVFYRASRMIAREFRFSGLDINMGCPVRKIVSQGGCAALIRQPALAAEIIQATKQGSGLPVSVKTRIGFNKVETEDWIGFLLEQNLDAITIHGRTQKEESEGPVHWDEIQKAVKLRNQMGKSTILVGNGDICSLPEARQKILETGCEGMMIGRGVFHNPWLFNEIQPDPSVEDKLQLLLKHVSTYTFTWGAEKNYEVLKRFFKIYASGFPGASHLRAMLMNTSDALQAAGLVDSFLSGKKWDPVSG